MGQARNRGTYEQRRDAALKAKERLAAAEELLRQDAMRKWEESRRNASIGVHRSGDVPVATTTRDPQSPRVRRVLQAGMLGAALAIGAALEPRRR